MIGRFHQRFALGTHASCSASTRQPDACDAPLTPHAPHRLGGEVSVRAIIAHVAFKHRIFHPVSGESPNTKKPHHLYTYARRTKRREGKKRAILVAVPWSPVHNNARRGASSHSGTPIICQHSHELTRLFVPPSPPLHQKPDSTNS